MSFWVPGAKAQNVPFFYYGNICLKIIIFNEGWNTVEAGGLGSLGMDFNFTNAKVTIFHNHDLL